MGVYEEGIVPVKISRLAEYISERRISPDEALVYIYSNPLYRKLYDEKAKWWYLSNEALYEDFERMRKKVVMRVSNPLLSSMRTLWRCMPLERYWRTSDICHIQRV